MAHASFDFQTVAARELSDQDLHTLLPGVPITQYNELEGKAFGELVDARGRGIIFFVQKEEPRVIEGHWLALLRQDDGVLLFDSYGGTKDPWYLASRWVSKRALEDLDQDAPVLADIVRASGLRPLYNPVRLQRMKEGISTCGRHCVVRLWHQDLQGEEYAHWLKAEDDDPDYTVCALTYPALGH